LSSYLLRRVKQKGEHSDTAMVRFLKSADRRILTKLLDRPKTVIAFTCAVFVGAMALVPLMGRDFLPQFNEGTAMVAVFAPPGISLDASNRIGAQAESLIMEVPEVSSVSRRTGRAEQDEHAMGVNISEIDIDFHPNPTRSREKILDSIRERLETIPGVGFNVGQPIAHLIDHMLTGVSAQIAIKIFGPDLENLRGSAASVQSSLNGIPGLVDLRIEQQTLIPQLKIHVMRDAAATFGMASGEIAGLLEAAFNGEIVTQFIEGQRFFDVFYRFDDTSRISEKAMGSTVLKTMPDGRSVRLEDVADIYTTEGPNEINRENAQRRIIVSANVSGRDLDSVIRDVRSAIDAKVTLPAGYYLVYGGQFESQREATKRILLFGLVALAGVVLMLYSHFKSPMIVSQVLLTIPFAFIGGVILLYYMNRTVTVASMIGFITLCGIASRNGIMMISHYLHLLKHEGETFSKEMIIRGSLERLVPVLMTASVTTFALLPLVFAAGQPGSEILQPVATVIVGGLVSSTLLDVFVTPTVFFNFAKKAAEKSLITNESEEIS
jgi:Cu/Ag efflux pump CusA